MEPQFHFHHKISVELNSVTRSALYGTLFSVYGSVSFNIFLYLLLYIFLKLFCFVLCFSKRSYVIECEFKGWGYFITKTILHVTIFYFYNSKKNHINMVSTYLVSMVMTKTKV